MNKTSEVIWSNVAENDLKNIIEYVAADSPSNAFRIFKTLNKQHQIFISFLKEAASSQNYEIKESYNIVN